MKNSTKSLAWTLPVMAMGVAARPLQKIERALEESARTQSTSSPPFPSITSIQPSSPAQVADGMSPAFVLVHQANKEYLGTGTNVLRTEDIEAIIEAMQALNDFQPPHGSSTESSTAGAPAQLKKRAWSKKKIFGTLAAGAAAAGAILTADHVSQSIGKNYGALATTDEIPSAIGMESTAPAVVHGSVPQAIGHAPSIVDFVGVEPSRDSVDSSRNSLDSSRNSMESGRNSIGSSRESIESGPRPGTPVADQPFQHSAKYRPVFEKWQTAEKLNGNPLILEGNPFTHTGAVHM